MPFSYLFALYLGPSAKHVFTDAPPNTEALHASRCLLYVHCACSA